MSPPGTPCTYCFTDLRRGGVCASWSSCVRPAETNHRWSLSEYRVQFLNIYYTVTRSGAVDKNTQPTTPCASRKQTRPRNPLCAVQRPRT